MTRRRSLLLFAAILSLSLTGMAQNGVPALAPALPDKLTDRTSGVSSQSSPSPRASSDPTTSSRTRSIFQTVIPQLVRVSKLNRVYLGVGPEQNFTYIAALRPKMAFIVDVRRGNLQLHLMYKALFELSADRADFIFRLFSQKRPEGLGPKSTADEIFAAVYDAYKATPEKVEANDRAQAESQDAAGPPDADASSAAHRRRPEGHRVRLHAVLLVRPWTLLLVDRRPRRPSRCANLLGPDGGRRREGAEPELPGERRATSSR